MKPLFLFIVLLMALVGCSKNPLGQASIIETTYESGAQKTLSISNTADQSTSENTAKAVTFTINKEDFPNLTCSGSVSGSSSNTAVVINTGIVITGTAPSCTATITPESNTSGTSTITLTVTDGAISKSDTFVLTITGINDPPTISNVANQTIAEDTATAIAFTINDPDSTLTCAGSVSGSSSSTGVIANSGIVITGTAPNCTATITPVLNVATGTSTITLTATDGALTANDTFVATISAVNDAPTVSDVADQAITEDVATPIAFTINDIDSTLTCAGSVSGTSSSAGVITNGGIVITGTAPNCTATITPVSNVGTGTSTITLTATDGALTGNDTFVLTITGINDPPTISNVANQTIAEDTATAIAFTINDPDSTLTCAGSVSGSSSITGVIANSGIVITGTAPNCTATITSVLNVATGTSTITLTVTDGALTANDTYVATISARPDLVNVTAPFDSVYGLGSSIIFEVIYDMTAIVSGVPRIPIIIDSGTVYAGYSSGSGSQELLFTYVVGAGQNDADGIVANSTIDLNSGTITGSGNNFPLNMSGLIGSLANVRVNTAFASPGQVSTLTQTNLSADRTQASFTWGVPTPGGAAISEYRVQYRQVGTVNFTTINPSPTTNSVTLTALTTEVNYEVRVAAYNGVIGPYSSLLSFSTVFTPRSLNALVWYEAKDINGTGVTPTDGASITTLVDKSGRGNNAALYGGETAGVIQTTSGQKVLRVSNAQYTTINSLGEGANTDIEVYLIAKVNVISDSFAFVNENEGDSTTRYGAHFPWGNGIAYVDLPMVDRISVAWGGNTTDILAWTFRGSTTQGRALERNGVSILTSGNKTNTEPLKKWSFLGSTAGNYNWDADFVAVFVFDKVLTSTQRQEFFNYIESNYGVIMP